MSSARRWFVCLALPLTLSWGRAATMEPVAADPVAAEIQRLGHDSYGIREAASRRLWELGRQALPKLREAGSNPDPEIARRARQLVRKIELEITPDSEPQVLALIERYAASTVDEKGRVMFSLRNHQAWRQMLRLFADEKDPVVRARLIGEMDAVAIEGAREKLVAGKTDEARELLELAPPEGSGPIALAEFHRTHGSWAGELAKAGGRPAWRLSLLRAGGEGSRARAEAVAAGEPRVAAALALLEGDPLPWLEAATAQDGDDTRAGYVRLIRKRWAGGTLTGDDLTPLAVMLNGDDELARDHATGLAFLLGQGGMGEAALVRSGRRLAFTHFDLLERVPDALRAFDLNPENPDFKSWIAKRFEPLLGREDDDGEQRQDLLAMANFLERRGLLEVAAAYEEPMAKLAREDPEEFMSLLGEMFDRDTAGHSAVGLATRIAAAYAREDEDKWRELVHNAFGEDRMFDDGWEWLGRISPKSGRAERFQAMLALFRLGSDPQRLRSAWLKKMHQSVETLPKEEARPRLEWLVRFAMVAGDPETAFYARERLGADAAGEALDPGNRVHLLFLAAADRWKEAADLWLATAAEHPERPEFHACAAASLRRAGKPQEAAEHDAWVEKLALGEAGTLNLIAEAYAYGGDFGRAAVFRERVLLVAPPGGKPWSDALEAHFEDRLDARDWKRAAALGEAIALARVGYDQPGSYAPAGMLRLRVNLDLARALSRLGDDRARSLATLDACHRLLATDGSLADTFFPGVRAAGLIREHDAWFEETWSALQPVLTLYPGGGNTANTAAWLAARACRRLDEAEALIRRALDESPDQAAYLDTCGEVWFARGNRKKALEWSARALAAGPHDPGLRRQHERFRSAPLPK